MFLLNEMKTVALGTVAPGNLIILKRGGKFGLGLLGEDPGPKLLQNPPMRVFVDLTTRTVPMLYQLQVISAICIDLGKPQVRTTGDSELFSANPQYSRPGNIAIDDTGTWLICQDTRISAESWLSISRGAVGHQRGDVAYVSQWELGVLDAEGEFWRLYAQPSS